MPRGIHRAVAVVLALHVAIVSDARLWSAPSSRHIAAPRAHRLGRQPRRPPVSMNTPFGTRGGIAAAAAAAAALPCVKTLAAASLLPTLLGIWKTGYAVSYGYGGAVAACAALSLPALRGLAWWHAAALLFYGTRLNLFLLCRELTLPADVHQMQSREATLGQRLKRLPVIIACSLLYFLLAAPLRVTAAAAPGSRAVGVAVACSFVGFAVAALGDLQKFATKSVKGKDHLVTGGLYKFLRHPNYTGECFGWTASFVAALLAGGSVRALLTNPWVAASALGWVGIMGVLAGEAAVGLEKKQKEKHGGKPEYEAWVRGSWSGPMLGAA